MTRLNNRVAKLETSHGIGARRVLFIKPRSGESDHQAVERHGVTPRDGDVVLIMRMANHDKIG